MCVLQLKKNVEPMKHTITVLIADVGLIVLNSVNSCLVLVRSIALKGVSVITVTYGMMMENAFTLEIVLVSTSFMYMFITVECLNI